MKFVDMLEYNRNIFKSYAEHLECFCKILLVLLCIFLNESELFFPNYLFIIFQAHLKLFSNAYLGRCVASWRHSDAKFE